MLTLPFAASRIYIGKDVIRKLEHVLMGMSQGTDTLVEIYK